MIETPTPLWHEESHEFLMAKAVERLPLSAADAATLIEYSSWPDRNDKGFQRLYWHFFEPTFGFGGYGRAKQLMAIGDMPSRGKAMHYLMDAGFPLHSYLHGGARIVRYCARAALLTR